MKKAIVTGATGFVGSAVVKELLNNKVAVIALGRRKIEETILIEYQKSEYFKYIEIDISNIKSLPNILLEQDVKIDNSCVFYNFAWSGEKRLSDGNFNQQIKNVTNSANAVVIAKQLGCSKFVNCGSMEETFAAIFLENIWKNEKYHSTQGDYALSKLASYELCMLTAYLEKIDYVHTRLSVPIDVNLTSNGYIPSVFRDILKGKHYEKPSNEQLFDIISLNDVASAYYLIGLNGENKANYFIGTAQPRTLTQYFEILHNYIYKTKSSHKTNIPNSSLLGAEYFDNSKLVKDTGFCISDTFEQFIKKICE